MVSRRLRRDLLRLDSSPLLQLLRSLPLSIPPSPSLKTTIYLPLTPPPSGGNKTTVRSPLLRPRLQSRPPRLHRLLTLPNLLLQPQKHRAPPQLRRLPRERGRRLTGGADPDARRPCLVRAVQFCRERWRVSGKEMAILHFILLPRRSFPPRQEFSADRDVAVTRRSRAQRTSRTAR